MNLTNESGVILVALGANLPSRFGAPKETLQTALKRLEECGVAVLACSRFWKTRPVPVSDQPWFVNAVASVRTELDPAQLLALLHRLEDEFGRVRTVVNAPRLIDLDLIAYGDTVLPPESGLTLPHPRAGERAFVLLPIQDIAPDWTHPVTGEGLASMLARVPADQMAEPME